MLPIESAHNRVIEKINLIREIFIDATIDTTNTLLRIDDCENTYRLAVVNIITNYYNNADERKCTRDYYRVLSEGHINNINELILSLGRQFPAYAKRLEIAMNINIATNIVRKNYDFCKCGARTIFIPEVNELQCSKQCGIVRKFECAIRDEAVDLVPASKHCTSQLSGTSRHYRFHIDRLQAVENKSFDATTLEKIKYVLTRDKYVLRDLNCKQMRKILKDNYVNATKLNDHTPLLVVTFGGRAPPRLDFTDDKLASLRFSKAMAIFEQIVPSGNKRYYLYFILKILEEMFKNDPEKLRIINYIHLQSRETVRKNDIIFKKICDLAEPEDGLVYRPTDTSCCT